MTVTIIIFTILSILVIGVIYSIVRYYDVSNEIKNNFEKYVKKLGFYIILLMILMNVTYGEEDPINNIQSIKSSQPILLPTNKLSDSSNMITGFLEESIWRKGVDDFLNDNISYNNSSIIIVA